MPRKSQRASVPEGEPSQKEYDRVILEVFRQFHKAGIGVIPFTI